MKVPNVVHLLAWSDHLIAESYEIQVLPVLLHVLPHLSIAEHQLDPEPLDHPLREPNRVDFFELLSYHEFREIKLPIGALKCVVDLIGIDLAVFLPIAAVMIGLSNPGFPTFLNQVLRDEFFPCGANRLLLVDSSCLLSEPLSSLADLSLREPEVFSLHR